MIRVLKSLCFVGLFVVAFPFGAQASFQGWIDAFEARAVQNGISRSVYRQAFAGVTSPDAAVIKAANYQPEFVQSKGAYIEGRVSTKRIANGQDKLREFDRLTRDIEQRFGVDRHVFVAIWGMESAYGEILKNRGIVKPVIRSLATLAYQDRKRKTFAEQQLIAALKILQNGDVSAQNMLGSWAGAMGHTQFIPTTYLAYAVDYTGDGTRDIWFSVGDALASTANYLKKSGWQNNRPWGSEVFLPNGFNYGLASKDYRPYSFWMRQGVQVVGSNLPRSESYRLILPDGSNGPKFLVSKNFKAILAYNNSTSYAIAVGHLADRLAGQGRLKADWPAEKNGLKYDDRVEIQTLLNRLGFDVGEPDGLIGSGTEAGIQAFQSSRGLKADGFADLDLLQRLRHEYMGQHRQH